jgi:RND family efflux transporter MFP subunit
MNRPLPFTRSHQLLTLAAAVAMLAACSPPPKPPAALPAVFVSTVRNDSGTTVRVLPGQLRPRIEAELSFRTGGKVIARAVDLGQAVRAGQVLGRIDAGDYQLAVQAATEQQRAAEVDSTQAASDAARFRRLLADGSVGAADAERQQARADAAAARLAQAQRQAELARNRAGYAVLTAPFDGVVTALRFENGQMVGEGHPVLSLARPGDLELQADVPEALAAGLKSWLASASLGDGKELIPLKLRELAPSAAAGSRTYRARFALGPSPAGAEWRMGMTAELRLVQPGRSPGAELPASALLVTTPPAAAVWLVDVQTGALQRTPVQLLSQTTDQVRVAGLADGALVVSVGAQKLDAGLKVRAVQRPLSLESAVAKR